jgi:hypothetical protein
MICTKELREVFGKCFYVLYMSNEGQEENKTSVPQDTPKNGESVIYHVDRSSTRCCPRLERFDRLSINPSDRRHFEDVKERDSSAELGSDLANKGLVTDVAIHRLIALEAYLSEPVELLIRISDRRAGTHTENRRGGVNGNLIGLKL